MKKCFCIAIAVMAMLVLLGSSVLQAKDIIISLTPTDSLQGTISFGTVQVVDARKDKSNIGRPDASRKREIKTADSLSVQLQNLVHAMMVPVVQ